MREIKNGSDILFPNTWIRCGRIQHILKGPVVQLEPLLEKDEVFVPYLGNFNVIGQKNKFI